MPVMAVPGAVRSVVVVAGRGAAAVGTVVVIGDGRPVTATVGPVVVIAPSLLAAAATIAIAILIAVC